MTNEELKEYCLSMANTIQKSIFCSIEPAMFCSWGVSQRIATFYKKMPALMLHVNGLIYKGAVVIAYNEGVDYYECYFLDKKGEVVDSLQDVCFDELGILLDRKIERPEKMSDDEYRSKIRKAS